MKTYWFGILIISLSLIILGFGVCHCCLYKTNQPLLLYSVSPVITSIVRV